jgi:hypothetical protein
MATRAALSGGDSHHWLLAPFSTGIGHREQFHQLSKRTLRSQIAIVNEEPGAAIVHRNEGIAGF